MIESVDVFFLYWKGLIRFMSQSKWARETLVEIGAELEDEIDMVEEQISEDTI